MEDEAVSGMCWCGVGRGIMGCVERYRLTGTVFLTGAAVLAVEVLAVRLLAPFFGNTVYSFSSVVSVVLAALSLGYWHGGRLADRAPSERTFFLFVGGAGMATLLVEVLAAVVLPLTSVIGIAFGPLVAASLLFAGPSYLFGALSPYAVKLSSLEAPERGVGRVSGDVFFASTCGSILGSLLSGFVLIPHVGVVPSMLGIGCAVTLLGLLGVWRSGVSVSLVLLVLASLGVLTYGAYGIAESLQRFSLPLGTVRYVEDGTYERIAVVDTDALGTLLPGRVLLLDRTLSSGVTLPERDLLFPYTTYYRLYRIATHAPSRMLVLGAGSGTVAEMLHRDVPEVPIDLVDIEPKLLSVAHTYFSLSETPEIAFRVADGRRFLRTATDTYDFIFSDMYATLYAVPWHVSTREYYELLRARLAPGGVYVGNYIARSVHEDRSYLWAVVRTLRSVFGEVAVFAVTDSVASSTVQNFMLLASADSALVGDVDEVLRADDMLAPFAAHLVAYDPSGLARYPIFTDSYAPVELYSAALAR